MSKRKYGFQALDYDNDVTIPSLVFGGGNIKVSSYLKNEAGDVGVGFTEVDEPKEVGFLDMSRYGKPVINEGIQFQFLFDKKESIDVVIDALQRAKAEL